MPLSTYTIETEQDTIRLAKEFAQNLKPGEVIALTGNLGAGKTFFVKEVCRELGITDASSPSFAIVNEYDGNEFKVYHFDFYRIKNVYELYDIGFDEYVSDEDAVTFIEWAEMYNEILPEKITKIDIIFNSECREFNIRRAE